MEGTGKKTILAIFSIILIAGLGFGGYYLGMYLDKQARDKQIEEAGGINKQFNDNTLGIKFTYPGSWTLTRSETEGSIVKLFTVSPNGSVFGYKYGLEKGDAKVCDEKNTQGGNGVEKCTFVTGTPTYARFEESTNNWRIAELGFGKYLSYDGDTFYYEVLDPSDLVELDKIMKSVVRSK